MEITWTTHAYGWEGTLTKLNRDRNDYTKSPNIRKAADTAYRKIQAQLQDKKLMKMRERLINATRANDEQTAVLIQQQMRYYLHEDTETGSYYQR